ncbi:MAG: hypothetical protein ACM3JD_14950 [Rudaea sp.]
MDSEYNSVTVLTRSHSISGQVSLRNRRFSDLLNDKRESALIVNEASLARLSNPDSPIRHQQLMIVPKNEIALAFENDTAPGRPRNLYAYVRKVAHDVLLTLDGAEVSGCMHTNGPLSDLALYEFVVTGAGDFFPVTEATVSFGENEHQTVNSSTVLVNRRRVHMISSIEVKG